MRSRSQTQPTVIEVGQVIAAYGIQGWIKVFSYCDPYQQIVQYKQWYLQPGEQLYELEQFRLSAHKSVLIKLRGVDDRDQALNLRKQTIAVKQSSLQPLRDNEYYWYQLHGLRVFNMQGECLGRVEKLLATGANDVLVVEQEGKPTRLLIPYVEDVFVRTVDLNKKVITVDWEPHNPQTYAH